MFFSHLAASAHSFLRPASGSYRLFSTTTAVEAGYKMKSHSGAKKRWRSLASGTSFKRPKAGHSHLNVTKSPARKNRLGNTAISTPTQTHKLKKLLLPYGTH
ncbi:hypothetical protein M378DRAFT_187084 [Amanita muscaria Koide BX008]|uniref:50S ribosomal protein L35 n=1 Tax=Amanita muscaria (strain Koide BX008) TaxID=946122 RepID=A0A0C2T982_AMAMK|nr:hypothetical protein M378DRAFT_187084 [Amanita muscaria Koide BX008]